MNTLLFVIFAFLMIILVIIFLVLANVVSILVELKKKHEALTKVVEASLNVLADTNGEFESINELFGHIKKYIEESLNVIEALEKRTRWMDCVDHDVNNMTNVMPPENGRGFVDYDRMEGDDE